MATSELTDFGVLGVNLDGGRIVGVNGVLSDFTQDVHVVATSGGTVISKLLLAPFSWIEFDCVRTRRPIPK
jgi:hypothetical protein